MKDGMNQGLGAWGSGGVKRRLTPAMTVVATAAKTKPSRPSARAHQAARRVRARSAKASAHLLDVRLPDWPSARPSNTAQPYSNAVI